MKMKRVAILAVILFALTQGAFSQSKPFSTDKDAFIEELNAYLTSATSKEDKADAEAIMKDFRGVWNNHYDTEEEALSIGIYELMRSKTGNRAYYNIFTFTEILLRAPYNGMTKSDINRFLTFTTRRFGKRQAQMDKYLKSCRDMFVDHLLGEKGATQWVAPNANFTFPTDTACLFEVKQCDLILQSKNDRSVIRDTRGRIDLMNHLWIGRGGRVDWSRFDLPSDKVYGIVDDYQVNLMGSSYHIEEIEFYNKFYFNQPCRCSFEDAITGALPNEKTQFPKAVSVDDQQEHGTFFGNVEFLGGFGMTGRSVSFFGTAEHPAQFVYKYRNRITVRTLSKRFLLTDNSLASSQASVRIYLYDSITGAVDSIYHNDVGFRYNDNKNLLLLYRKDNGVGTGPFHDTYHDFDLFLEAIYWKRDSDQMEFRRVEGTSGESEGLIASVNYFRKSDYLKIQALDNKHPMEHLNQFLKLYADDHNRFHVNDYTNYVKYPLSQVLSLMLNLQAEGYVEYDKDTQMVTVLPRFFDVLASDHDEFDFDVIKFQTKVTDRQPNVRLVLGTNDMVVNGIRDYQGKTDASTVTLSDFKHVLILPDNGRIVLKKDRNFNFSGCIMAGMYEFFTKESLFNYNTFSIEMAKVDSLRFYARFKGKVLPVEGVLERLHGTLEIDANDNKSSKRETPEFPRFSSTGNAYRFYRDINGGVFDLELPLDTLTDEDLAGKFYYCLEPFMVERLDNLDSVDVAFQGRLVSGGIFPDINEPLVVMDDHSLGFRHVIGDGQASRLPMYDSLGGFHQEVLLSNEGFYGKGRLDVETSSFEAERFDFYLDSVTSSVQSFTMQERDGEVGFPKASCGPVDIKWVVTEPRLYTTTLDEPICLYGNTFFTGTTKLSGQGYQGDGVLTFGLTRFDSHFFDFDSQSFVADSSNFTLFDEDGQTKAFLADNYRASVDLAGQKVRFGYLDENSNLDFPLNQFYCTLNQAEWDMSSNTIHLSGEPSEFVSLLPEHDSLSFLSTNADYDMNDYTVHAHGVASVKVADVEIMPWDHNINIQRNATLAPLEHAVIVADTSSQLHVFKDAAVSIYSKHDYAALGVKDYIDMEGVATPVFYDEIKPVDGVTVASADIADTLHFMLSPWIGFQGKVTTRVTDTLDRYKGFFLMEQSCVEDTVWMASDTMVNPQTISIPVNVKKLKREHESLLNGLDFVLPMEKGDLSYDNNGRQYIINNELCSFSYSDRCVATVHGVSNLSMDEGLTEFACFGDFVGYPNDSITMDVMNVFNAPVFDNQVLADIADIYSMVEGGAIDLSQTGYVDYLRVERGEDAAADLQREMELVPYPVIHEGDFYHKTIVIPSLKMVWNPELRAYISVGKIGLGSLGGHVVNRYVDGYVMFDRRLGVMTYLFVNDMFMTYISYNCGDGQLQVHATYGTVNARLSDLSEKSRTAKSKDARFEYVVTPYEAMTGFLSRLKRAGVE